MTMTSPVFYSVLAYNGTYMLPNTRSSRSSSARCLDDARSEAAERKVTLWQRDSVAFVPLRRGIG